MFGYIVMNKPEIKFKDFDLYRSFYCGLCRELKSKYGISGQISLTYDMTFVVILLSALYEPPTQKGSTRCIIHPVCKQPVRRNTVTEYAADMNVLLTYYKCRDDWEDEKKVTALGYSKVLQGKVKKLDQKYPDKSRRIQKLLSELSEMEKSGEKDIDKMAGCFGKIMEEIFAWKQDVWEDTLRRMGFFLGKFIYLLDAYDDVEEDIKNKNYNPFSEQYIIEGFDEQVRRILIMMMAQTCREFEKLPIIKYTDILRNILYSGVWCRFEVIHKKRKEAAKQPPKENGFIAVSIGEGIKEIFQGLGVDYLIEGGQTMNPSTEDMLNAIAKVNAKTIYIFPNNKNIVLAANQARELTEDKESVVVPTKTIPQGITAMISYVPEKNSAENTEAMLQAIEHVKTGQITYAVRDTRIDDKEIHEGDMMGIGDHGILAVGKDRMEVAKETVAQMVDDESEVMSFYYGADTEEAEAEELATALEEAYPDCDVELNAGGQPIYYYVISVE